MVIRAPHAADAQVAAIAIMREDDAAKILSYGDTVLRACDVYLLQKPDAWLNDALIAFKVGACARPRRHGSLAWHGIAWHRPTGGRTGTTPVGRAPRLQFEHLDRDELPSGHDVSFIPGAMTLLLALAPAEEACLLLRPLRLHARGLVLFALNDNDDPDRASGGSHW